MFLGQPRIEAILRSHLEKYGCSVEFATEVQSFEDDGDRVLAKIVKKRDGEEVPETFEASYLIGADGAKGVYFPWFNTVACEGSTFLQVSLGNNLD